MSVGLALLQHLVNLLRARHKTLRGALRYLKFTTYPYSKTDLHIDLVILVFMDGQVHFGSCKKSRLF